MAAAVGAARRIVACIGASPEFTLVMARSFPAVPAASMPASLPPRLDAPDRAAGPHETPSPPRQSLRPGAAPHRGDNGHSPNWATARSIPADVALPLPHRPSESAPPPDWSAPEDNPVAA